MSLRLATVHENSLRPLSPVFSIGGSPIFMAARNLLFLLFTQKQIPRRSRRDLLGMTGRGDFRQSGATRSDFRTPVESIGLQKPENLLLKMKKSRCFAALSMTVWETFIFICGPKTHVTLGNGRSPRYHPEHPGAGEGSAFLRGTRRSWLPLLQAPVRKRIQRFGGCQPRSSDDRDEWPVTVTSKPQRGSGEEQSCWLHPHSPLVTGHCHSSLASCFLIEFNQLRGSTFRPSSWPANASRLVMEQRSVRRRGTRPGPCQALLGR
jgi:hypothetical protein